MRVLLDENVDRRLRSLFDSTMDVSTVTEQGWSGTKNGDLLRLAEERFDVIVTMDRNIQHQQNLSSFNIGVVLIMAASSRRKDIEPMMSQVIDAVREMASGMLKIVAS